MSIYRYGPWENFGPVTEPEPWLCDRCDDDAPNLAEWEHDSTGEILCAFHFESEESA